ncbi:MAG: DUF2188 domain-containing protein [Magnetococcus sp. WYHC-3]
MANSSGNSKSGGTRHVVPRGDQWANLKGGNERATSLHNTQREAEQAAREQSRREGSELLIHRPNGQIRQKDSYGNDPYPPKG